MATSKTPPRLKKTKSSYGVTFEEKISHSALAVTLGDRLRRRAPMRNVRGDRPEQH